MTVDGSPAVDGRDAPSDDERWFLADEREFLRRSLDDAEREHDAGDLSDDDHALLVARDRARLAEVEADLAALGPQPKSGRAEAEPPGAAERPPLPLWRKIGIVAACLLIVTGGVILVTHYVQARQPGQASSGSVTLSQAQLIEQQLQQALALNNGGQTKAALVLYDKVLSEDPSNPAALAYAGYLQWNVGSAAAVPSLVKIGRAEIEKSIRALAELLRGAPLLRPRAREPGPQRCCRRRPIRRVPGRRPPAGRAAAGGGRCRPRLPGGGPAGPGCVRHDSTSTSTSAP